MTVPFKRLPPWMPSFGDGISWVQSVIRNRLSVRGVVLAFPALLQLTVWPLKGGRVMLSLITFTICRGIWHWNCAATEMTDGENFEGKGMLLPIIWSHSLYLDINWSIGHQSPFIFILFILEDTDCRPYVTPTVTKADNKGSCVNKFLFQNWIPKSWGRRERREAYRPLLNNSQGKQALLSNFMFLDPSHRNENIIHFWKSGSKGKDILWHWTELNVPICLLKRPNTVLLQTADLVTLSSSMAGSPSELISCLDRVKPLGQLNSLWNPEYICCWAEAQVGEEGQGEAPEREDHPALHCPVLGAQSSEPQTCCVVLHWALRLGLEGVFKDWYRW